MKTTYCVRCKKDADNIDPKMFRTKNNRLLMLMIIDYLVFVKIKSRDL